MTSNDNSSVLPIADAEGSKPSVSFPSNPLSKLAQSSADESHPIAGQEAVSTSFQTGEIPTPSSLTDLAGINVDRTRPAGIQNPIRGSESSSEVTTKRSLPSGRFVTKTNESNYVDPFTKPPSNPRNLGQRNTSGASKAQRLPVDYKVKSQDAPKQQARKGPQINNSDLKGTGWDDFEKVISAADQAIAREAMNSTNTIARPAIVENFKKVTLGTGLDDRRIIRSQKTHLPMQSTGGQKSTDAPAQPIEAPTSSMDLKGPDKSYAPGSDAAFNTITDMLLFWRSNFGDRRVCLTSDPKGPHLTYEQLVRFSTARVDDPRYQYAGYLTGDVLDNVTAALVDHDVYVVRTASVSLWMNADTDAVSQSVPVVKEGYNFIIMYINSGGNPGLHWHVAVFDIKKEVCHIRDSAYDEHRVQNTASYMKAFSFYQWGRDFTVTTDPGPQQDDAYNCGVFAHDNAVQLVSGGTDYYASGSVRRLKLLQAILDKARIFAQVVWQANPGLRIFPPTAVGDKSITSDVDLSKKSDGRLSLRRAQTDWDGQMSVTSMAASSKPEWADLDDRATDSIAASEAYSADIGLTDPRPRIVRHGGLEDVNMGMDLEDDEATNRLALTLAASTANVCFEKPQSWRSLPQENNARTEWAKKQVLERIPDYMQLHEVKSDGRSTFLSAADVVGHYSGAKPTHNPRPAIMLIQDQTLIVTEVLKLAVPGVYTVLNMASEKRPGGQLFMNSLQQEESLCMQSDLFHRLTQMSKHYPLQPGCLIVSEDVFVCFTNAQYALPREKCFTTHVVSMAAPICRPDMNFAKYIHSDQAIQMQENIKTLLDAADAAETNVLILGAWGCGVYRNPPAAVAQLFRAELSTRDWSRSSLTHVIFAIFDESEGQKVWRPFKRVFAGSLPGFEPTFVDHVADYCSTLLFNQLGAELRAEK